MIWLLPTSLNSWISLLPGSLPFSHTSLFLIGRHAKLVPFSIIQISGFMSSKKILSWACCLLFIPLPLSYHSVLFSSLVLITIWNSLIFLLNCYLLQWNLSVRDLRLCFVYRYVSSTQNSFWHLPGAQWIFVERMNDAQDTL